MSRLDSDEVTFHDVAALFSKEEWTLLHEWQKELYRNVMKEIHQALISLGPLIATTVVSLRTKEKEELRPVHNKDCERRPRICHSPSDTAANPEVLFTIKSEEHLQLNSPRVSEGRERNDCPSTEFQFFNTDFCLRNDEEPVSVFINHTGAEIGESSKLPNSGHDVVSVFIKDEERTSCMDHQDSKRIESISSLTGYGTMNRQHKVGNPVKHTGKATPLKASSGSAKAKMVQSYEKGTHSRSQLWTEINQALGGEETTQCERGFSDPANLSFHQGTPKVQTSETYNEWGSNLRHANLFTCEPNIQTNVSLYSLNECEKSFSRKEYLLQHKITHVGVRPYQCNECEKSFSKKDNLCKHKRTHTGERPYHCTLCKKSFSQKGVLKRHQRTHMEVTGGLETKVNWTTEG